MVQSFKRGDKTANEETTHENPANPAFNRHLAYQHHPVPRLHRRHRRHRAGPAGLAFFLTNLKVHL